MALTGLSSLNIELTAHCDKATKCHFCAHQDQKKNAGLTFGEMEFWLLRKIAQQVPIGMPVQFHRDGDAVGYSKVGEALDLFRHQITSLVTHGETLAEKAEEIIGRCDVVTVSVLKGDPDASIQWSSVVQFLNKKGTSRPRVNIKIVGADPEPNPWSELGLPILYRRLHTAENERYTRTTPPIPELGICLDFLGKPAIDWQGRMFQCVRFDRTDEGLIGDLRTQTLDEIWNGPIRQQWWLAHVEGRRHDASKRCHDCTYWGIPAT